MKATNFLKLNWFLACAMLLRAEVQADGSIADGFDGYAAGVALEGGSNGVSGVGLNGGVGWGGAYDVSNAIKTLVKAENRAAAPVIYSSGEVSLHGGERALRFYDVANGTYAVQRKLGRDFQAAAAETLWFRFLFRTSAASPLTNQDFFQVGFDDNANALNGNPRVSIGANTVGTVFAPSQPFQFFSRSTTAVASSAFYSDISIAAATTYLLIGEIVPTGGVYSTVNLYVNPTSQSLPAVPSASFTANSGLSVLSYLFIRCVGLDNGDAYVIDELKIGDNYTKMVQPNPLGEALSWAAPAQVGDIGALRWSALFGATILERSTALKPGEWETISGPWSREGDDYVVPIEHQGHEREFFRLRR